MARRAPAFPVSKLDAQELDFATDRLRTPDLFENRKLGGEMCLKRERRAKRFRNCDDRPHTGFC
jgi:hypothetical protein